MIIVVASKDHGNDPHVPHVSCGFLNQGLEKEDFVPVYLLVLYLSYYLTSVVIKSFSYGDATILSAICWLPANINHSHIPAATSLCFSASDKPIS